MPDPIPDIVSSTGLPSEVWPSARPRLTPRLQGYDYTLSPHGWQKQSDSNSTFYGWIRIRENTVGALQRLPAAQVLGHATLVRTPAQIVAMVSIAEAAFASMDESYCQLLWVMVEIIEQAFRSNRTGFQHFQSVQKRILYDSDEIHDFEKRMSQGREQWREKPVYDSDEMYNFEERMSRGWKKSEYLSKKKLERSQGREEWWERSADQLVRTPSIEFPSMGPLLGVGNKDGEWFFCAQYGEPECQAFAVLLDWLEAQLSGVITSSETRSSSRRHIEAETGTWPFGRVKSITAPNQKDATGCWRDKILSGKILEIPTQGVEELAKPTPFQTPERSDCLILTAAALWSLFDNSLERMPNCQCTFKAASNDLIQCRSKEDGWLIWHLSSDGSFCEGKNCDRNVRIALILEEVGERLHTTTPCALGWPAMRRHSPNSILWQTLSATKDFKDNTVVKYSVKELQALAQLSVPAVAVPQFGGGVTFSKRHYEIANSVDHESVIAMERVAAAVVLVYDERRGLHLTCDGADVIEMCCMQSLRDMGCDMNISPLFSHSSALLRLHTWYSSSFTSIRRTYFTGDHLVRQATKKISELIETTKEALAKDRKFLYWLLEDVCYSRGRW